MEVFLEVMKHVLYIATIGGVAFAYGKNRKKVNEAAVKVAERLKSLRDD